VTSELHMAERCYSDTMLKNDSYRTGSGAQLSHQCVNVVRFKNLYLIFFCTAADLLNWMMQPNTCIQMQSLIILVWIKLHL